MKKESLMASSYEQNPPPWYKQFWPWFIIALPATTVVAGITTLIISIYTADELVRDNYYKDGLAINKQLTQDREAQRLKTRATIHFGENQQDVLLDLQGQFVQPPEILHLQLAHPTTSKRDLQITLRLAADEYYHGQFEQVVQGRWYISLSNQRIEQSEVSSKEENPQKAKQWRLVDELDLRKSSSIVLVPQQ